MGRALELISFQATAPGAGAAFLAVPGNSLTLRDSRAPIWLVAFWQRRQGGPAFTRLTSPLLHDAVVGMQFTSAAGVSLNYRGKAQRLFAQDLITAFGSGSATAGDIEQSCFLAAYEDLPGVNANLIEETELMRRGEEVYSWTNTLALGTAGGYSGAEAVNAEQDQFKAVMDYAIIGYEVSVAAAAVRWVSSDFGNLGVGGPAGSAGSAGTGSGELTANWFVDLSRITGMPLIPVFNSANKALTLVDGLTDENGVDAVITTTAVRLSPRMKPRAS